MCGLSLTTPAIETNVTSTGESSSTETMSGTGQAQETIEETTAGGGGKTTSSDQAKQDGAISFVFNPKSGPAGTKVTLSLSAPVPSSAKVYYNGQLKQTSISSDGKTLTITISAGDSSGYFKVEYDGKSMQAAEQFTVTATPNNLPTITVIKLTYPVNFMDYYQGKFFANIGYEFTAEASDPDGDNLSYEWKTSGGKIFQTKDNTIGWSADFPGNYTIEVKVTDGKGGEAISSMTFEVLLLKKGEFPIVSGESGSLTYLELSEPGTYIYAGDTFTNKPCRGFISFNISGFSGIKIMDSNLWTDGIQVYGDPSFMGPLYVNIVEWGAQPMIQSDFDKPGIVLGSGFGSSGAGSIDFTNSGKELTSYLQSAIDAGKDRFQFRIQFTGALSDNDNEADGWRYEQGKVHFWFSYIQ
jgi:hypothetical protein